MFSESASQSIQFPNESSSMAAHQVEAPRSFAVSSSTAADRWERKPSTVDSVKELPEYPDTLGNEEIGIKNPETSFEHFFRVNVQLLVGLGLFSRDFSLSGRPVNTNSRNVLPVFLEVSQLMFLTVCQIRSFLIFWKTDPDFAVTIFTGMLPGALCTFKGFRLWLCQVELRELLIHMAILWEKSRFQANLQEETLKIAERTRYVRSWYLAMVIFIAVSYGMRPYLLLLQFQLTHGPNETYDYSVTGLPTLYPFTIDTFEKYLVCIIWEMIMGLLLVLYWAASDTMFAQLVSHVAIQFQVLHHDLRSIGAELKISSAKDEEVLLRKLCSIAKRHSRLFAHCKSIEAIYNPIIFVTMVSMALTMCFCVLSVQREMTKGNYEEIAKNVAHLLTIVGQSIIYCGYADNLTDQSFLIAQAAYQCHWIERRSNFKINLQIIMMQAQKPYYLSGYGFFYLTLNQITTIVNTAMSYFTILKTMT